MDKYTLDKLKNRYWFFSAPDWIGMMESMRAETLLNSAIILLMEEMLIDYDKPLFEEVDL